MQKQSIGVVAHFPELPHPPLAKKSVSRRRVRNIPETYDETMVRVTGRRHRYNYSYIYTVVVIKSWSLC